MRASNLQKLTNQLKVTYPGVIIYGIGDAAHKKTANDHNEDDTAGVATSQYDSDSKQEHRAIDIMLGPKFSSASANKVVQALVKSPANQKRLLYVIFNRQIWSRDSGWQPRTQLGDPHTDHIHVSGLAADDDDIAGWTLTTTMTPAPPTTPKETHMLDELITVDADIERLSGSYIKAGQKIKVSRFMQLQFISAHRAFTTSLAIKDVVPLVQSSLASLNTSIAEVKALLAEASGNPDVVALTQKLEAESQATRAYVEGLMVVHTAGENQLAEKMSTAWKDSVVE